MSKQYCYLCPNYLLRESFTVTPTPVCRLLNREIPTLDCVGDLRDVLPTLDSIPYWCPLEDNGETDEKE